MALKQVISMKKKPKRLIFHVDVNSAYLSWEAARRLAEGGSDLRLVPSAVGGNREKRTGIILAKSIPAKRYGIKTGEPVSMALRKCPTLVLVPPDFRLYQKNSRAFMSICREFAPVAEQFSIDECFLDMTGTELIYPDPFAAACALKNRIRDELGFTVNIGIGESRLTAKMASDFEKPDKVHTLFDEEIPSKLWPLPAGSLFSVGRSKAERLAADGILTVGDLANAQPERIRALLGKKAGDHIRAFARGEDDSPVAAEREEAKGYNISVTLEEDVDDRDRALNILLLLADSVTARMRSEGGRAYCIGVSLRSGKFVDRSHQVTLRQPTDITSEVFSICRKLFDELWEKEPLRLLGINLTNITRSREEQLSLFDSTGREKEQQVDRAVDAIRRRFGSDSIVRGASLDTGVEVGRKFKTGKDDRGRNKR